jgi:hypothetical protein
MENIGFTNMNMMLENNKKTCEYEIEISNENYENYTDLPFEIEVIITKE